MTTRSDITKELNRRKIQEELARRSSGERTASPGFLQQAARSLEIPEEAAAESGIGAFFSGARRGAENIGLGILERGAEVGQFFGADTQEFQRDIGTGRKVSESQIAKTREQRPLTTGAGEIAGSIASFPVAPARIPQAIAAGAAFGAVQEAETGGDLALNILQDAAIGGLGAFAAPFIQKGLRKAGALYSAIIKKATGRDPRPEMFLPNGDLSDIGKNSIEKLGISQDDFSRLFNQLDQNLEPIAATRAARAQEQGIPLTTAQATQDFTQQEAEQTLRSSISREGEAARQIETAQQQAIGGAQESFERGFGELADREARGGVVQTALRDLQQEGRRNVSELYTQAKAVEGIAAPIDNNALLDSIDEILELPVDDKVVKSVETLMAKFGLIEGEVKAAGRFFNVTDAQGNTVKFRGEQTPLTLDNAEEFRKGLNKLFSADQSGAVSSIVKTLDNLVDKSVSQLPEGAARTAAFQQARGAARAQKELFSAKDIVQNLVGLKKGTKTDLIQPDRVIDSIIKGANAKGNLQRIKKVLLDNPNNKTLDAWKSIQAQGVADIFGKSINPATGDISGQRLASAIKAFGGGSTGEGNRRLKILLGDKFNQFNNLVSAIGDATIPVKGTTNPSGTAYKVINFMTRIGSVGTFGADAVIPLINKAKDSAKSRKVLQNIERAKPERVRQAVRANNELIDSFVRLGTVGALRDQ